MFRLFHRSSRTSRRIFTPITTNAQNPIKSQLRQLEVERKFLATPAAISYLRSVDQNSIFQAHKILGKRIDRDIYYDIDGLLFSKGIYVRQRNGAWEAKIRVGGDYTNSAFIEVEGHDAVKEAIEKGLPSSLPSTSIKDGLKCCAAFTSKRESWLLDEVFRVDVDTTDFGHVVGEVELTRLLKKVDVDGWEEDENGLRREMDEEIEEFMRRYALAFPVGRPVGKLSAYFKWVSAGS